MSGDLPREWKKHIHEDSIVTHFINTNESYMVGIYGKKYRDICSTWLQWLEGPIIDATDMVPSRIPHDTRVNVYTMVRVSDRNRSRNFIWEKTWSNDFLFTVLSPPGRPLIDLLYYQRYYYRIKRSSAVDFFYCGYCGHWFRRTLEKGAKHFVSCLRCIYCQKTIATMEDHLASGECHPIDIIHDLQANRKFYRFPKKLINNPGWISGVLRRDIYYWDTETFRNWQHPTYKPYCIGVRRHDDTQTVTTFWGEGCLGKFTDYILDIDGPSEVIFYAWNGSGFDNLLILGRFTDLGVLICEDGFIKKGGRLVAFSVISPRTRVKITFKDPLLLYPSSLLEACKTLGAPPHMVKGDFEHNLVYDIDTASEYKEEILDYLRTDVMALGFVTSTIGENMYTTYGIDIGSHYTLPHLANSAWLKSARDLMEKRVRIPNAAEDIDWRSSIRGGVVMPQVRKWKISGVDFRNITYEACANGCLYLLDCNSLYPTVMHNERFARCGYTIYYEDALLHRQHIFSTMDEHWRVRWNIFEVDVKCPKNIVTPFLPARIDGVIIYDLKKKKREMYYGNELMHACNDLGYRVTKVYREFRFNVLDVEKDSAFIFKDFIAANIQRRKDNPIAGTPANTIPKLMNNSVYGRTIKRPILEKQYVVPVGMLEQQDERDQQIPVTDADGQITGFFIDKKVDKVRIDGAFYLGGYILSASRVWMSKALLNINGYKDPNRSYLYKDTDSMLLRAEAVRAMTVLWKGKEMGQFKNDLEDDGRIIAYIALAPKTYCLVYIDSKGRIYTKVRCKGIPHERKPIVTNINDLFSPHNPALAAKVNLIDKARDEELPSLQVDLRFQAYAIERNDGTNIVSGYLSYGIFEALLDKELKKVKVYFAGVEKHYLPSKDIPGFSLLPTYRERQLAATDWWAQNKRIIVPGDEFTYPVGYES